jgi:hypothetical protein
MQVQDSSETIPAEEWRYLQVACAVIVVIVVTALAGWIVDRSLHDDPSALELTEKCLRREKLLPIEPSPVDAIASTARGGTLATRVEGTGVLVVIAKSDEEAKDLVNTYLQTTGRNIEARLDVRGRVIYVWEGAFGPLSTQRETMYDCWYE